VTILDANILLYATDNAAPEHRPISDWLKRLLADGEIIGLPWISLWAFLRISTNPRLWANAKSGSEACALVKLWLDQPGIVVPEAGPRHAEIIERMITVYKVSGPLVTDAALAALAIEHGATLASTDQDFRRFPEVRWMNPLESKP
jgi:uncharacterized protein